MVLAQYDVSVGRLAIGAVPSEMLLLLDFLPSA